MNQLQTNIFFQRIAAIFMIVALLWLTISLPVVVSSQQKIAKQEKKSTGAPISSNDEEASNPLTNTTEEKTPSAPSVLNEYLHLSDEMEHPSPINALHAASHIAEPYTAYHGELTGPPPKI